jgi:hypothetical protein
MKQRVERPADPEVFLDFLVRCTKATRDGGE